MSLRIDTKKILASSLEKLLETKPLQSIRVKEITANCGASNATFYRHFKDKYDLMNWVYKANVDAILSQYQDITEWRKWLLQVLRFVRGKDVYFGRIVRYKEQNSFLEFLTHYSLTYFYDKTVLYLKPSLVPEKMKIAIKIYCYGCCSVVMEWIEGGCKSTAEELTEYICASVPEPIVCFIG